MTYFKTQGRRPIHIHPIDQRVVEAAIDPPRRWQEQVELVAEQAPWIDLGAECPGEGPSRREFRGFVIEVAGRNAGRIVTRHGITGLETGETTDIRLAAPAGVVDVGVAHFGNPPTVAAYAGDKQVAEAAADERTRHIENLRPVGKKIDRVTLTSPDAEAILNYIRSQPEAPRRKSTRR
jgi:hypothetical protein